MKIRTVLYANEGMVLTNGTDYGKEIWLAEGADPAAYRQITEAEYDLYLEQSGVSGLGIEY